MKDLYTLGEMTDVLRSRGFKGTLTQVKYAVETYKIEPVQRVGILRVWNEEGIEQTRRALARIADNKEPR